MAKTGCNQRKIYKQAISRIYKQRLKGFIFLNKKLREINGEKNYGNS